MTQMKKTQVYLREDELEAVRTVVLKPAAQGPVAIWDGEPRRPSLDYDSIYDDV